MARLGRAVGVAVLATAAVCLAGRGAAGAADVRNGSPPQAGPLRLTLMAQQEAPPPGPPPPARPTGGPPPGPAGSGPHRHPRGDPPPAPPGRHPPGPAPEPGSA